MVVMKTVMIMLISINNNYIQMITTKITKTIRAALTLLILMLMLKLATVIMRK